MSFRLHLSYRCLGLGLAAALVACNTQRPASNPEQARSVSQLSTIACAPVTSDAPVALQKKPGYQQAAISVKDESGREVQNLGKDDFVVMRGDEILPVQFAEYVTNGPASVLILADTSGSTGPKLPQTREAITQVVNVLDPRDDVALIAFSGKPFLLQTFTLDHSLVIQREATLHAFGSTSLYDAVATATATLSRSCYARRVLVVISDGIENTSGKSLDDATGSIKLDGISAYSIAIGNSDASGDSGWSVGSLAVSRGEADEVDEKSLGLLVSPSRGATFRVGETGDRDLLAVAAKSMLEASRGQYIVGFIDASKAEVPAVNIRIRNHEDYAVFRQRPSLTASTIATQAPSLSRPSS
jgi:VWFA-related protein